MSEPADKNQFDYIIEWCCEKKKPVRWERDTQRETKIENKEKNWQIQRWWVGNNFSK